MPLKFEVNLLSTLFWANAIILVFRTNQFWPQSGYWRRSPLMRDLRPVAVIVSYILGICLSVLSVTRYAQQSIDLHLLVVAFFNDLFMCLIFRTELSGMTWWWSPSQPTCDGEYERPRRPRSFVANLSPRTTSSMKTTTTSIPRPSRSTPPSRSRGTPTRPTTTRSSTRTRTSRTTTSWCTTSTPSSGSGRTRRRPRARPRGRVRVHDLLCDRDTIVGHHRGGVGGKNGTFAPTSTLFSSERIAI